MLTSLFTLLVTLPLFAFASSDSALEEIAVNTCISAVQIHYACESTTPANHTCLCEQRLWQVACYDNHASATFSQPNRAVVEKEMSTYCRAAGSVGATMVQHQERLQNRQLGSILASIGGDINSFFSGLAPAPATATHAPAVSIPPSIVATSRANPHESAKNPVSTPPAPTSKANNTPTSSARLPASTSDSVSSSPIPTSETQSAAPSTVLSSTVLPSATSAVPAPAKSGPSSGLIVGALFGVIVGLVFLGLLVMFILQKRKKASAEASAANAEDDREALHRKAPSMETIPVNSVVEDDKSVYHMHEPQMPVGTNDIPMHAWELDSLERPAPVELEAPHTYRNQQPVPDCLRVGSRT